jgi:hypothetical protein
MTHSNTARNRPVLQGSCEGWRLVPDADVVYCEGWDPVSRDAYGVMSEAAAAGRDRDGAQYAVLLQELGRLGWGMPWRLPVR